ncbi:MAG: response regulator transcription factor [Schleiferiaceae bacterium]|nr:response regulator transcription factor [Schleiferiaceae bacterium]
MTPRILIVEDELLVAYNLSMLLENHGYSVVSVCKSLHNAIEMLDKLLPDLVILDVNLRSDGDGIQVGQYINSKLNIPFIYVTGHTNLETMQRLQETQPSSYLSKPFKEIDVVNNVRIALYKHLEQSDSYRSTIVKGNSKYSMQTQRVIQYIYDNLTKSLTIEELSDLINWNKFHFIREFKSETGLTPYQFILKAKVDRGEQLLEHFDYSIADIAFELGFGNENNFRNAFIKFKGKSPVSYRKGKY